MSQCMVEEEGLMKMSGCFWKPLASFNPLILQKGKFLTEGMKNIDDSLVSLFP